MEKWLQDINAVVTPVGYVHPKTGELLKAVRLDIAPAKDNSVGEDKPEKETQGHKVETKSDPVVVDADADSAAAGAADAVATDAATAANGDTAADGDAAANAVADTAADAVVTDAAATQVASEPKKRGKASK